MKDIESILSRSENIVGEFINHDDERIREKADKIFNILTEIKSKKKIIDDHIMQGALYGALISGGSILSYLLAKHEDSKLGYVLGILSAVYVGGFIGSRIGEIVGSYKARNNK